MILEELLSTMETFNCLIYGNDEHLIVDATHEPIPKRFKNCNVIELSPVSDKLFITIDTSTDTLPLDEIKSQVDRTGELMNDCNNLDTAKEELITGNVSIKSQRENHNHQLQHGVFN